MDQQAPWRGKNHFVGLGGNCKNKYSAKRALECMHKQWSEKASDGFDLSHSKHPPSETLDPCMPNWQWRHGSICLSAIISRV
jgi:hypothetical protein